MMNVMTFEEKVWEIDQIRVVIRAPWDKEVGDFDWKNKAADNSSITNWLDNRILPKIGGLSAIIIEGTGLKPHGRKTLDKVRNSYKVD